MPKNQCNLGSDNTEIYVNPGRLRPGFSTLLLSGQPDHTLAAALLTGERRLQPFQHPPRLRLKTEWRIDNQHSASVHAAAPAFGQYRHFDLQYLADAGRDDAALERAHRECLHQPGP